MRVFTLLESTYLILHAVTLFQATGEEGELSIIASELLEFNKTREMITEHDNRKKGIPLSVCVKELLGGD